MNYGYQNEYDFVELFNEKYIDELDLNSQNFLNELFDNEIKNDEKIKSWKNKMMQFMQGRYGVDELSRFTMGAALVLIILTMFITMFNRNLGSIFDFLGIAAIVYAYFRIFSRNIQQRYAENQKYLQNMGTIIYLKGSAATLIKRLEGSNNPTLEGAENKEDKIKKLLKQRDPVYEKFADIKVVTGVKPFDELIAEIEEKLKA